MSEINKIVNQLSKLTIIESVELIKKLENVWGINTKFSNDNTLSNNDTQKKDEKNSYDIFLKSFGDRKISIIKEVKSITNLSLIKAKEIVDAVPKIIKSSVDKKEAETIKKKLESLGATVTLK